ncbi:hypothetical protein E4S40_09930 [Algoriphagus kandeliae]|uniref:Uncharacterized protein n=1 Tax=Algoriphagus kandeliae TaxID=2562278 RepID=A0A4Y9QNX3_9BACT|nr:hypothetical protein [Algoriphagus kandeliae]TFV94341.1 hypothetical protein E4S40_09930 [Algoriphagus kandeliae]
MKAIVDFVSDKKILIALFFLLVALNLSLSFFMPKDHALDLKFAYTFSEAYQSLSEMDLDTRKFYRFGIWALDFPYMIVYSLFFAGILYRFWRSQTLITLPFLVAAFDLFENLIVLRILKLFPEPNRLLTLLASGFTTLKWLTVGVMVLVLIVGVWRYYFSGKISTSSSS